MPNNFRQRAICVQRSVDLLQTLVGVCSVSLTFVLMDSNLTLLHARPRTRVWKRETEPIDAYVTVAIYSGHEHFVSAITHLPPTADYPGGLQGDRAC